MNTDEAWAFPREYNSHADIPIPLPINLDACPVDPRVEQLEELLKVGRDLLKALWMWYPEQFDEQVENFCSRVEDALPNNAVVAQR